MPLNVGSWTSSTLQGKVKLAGRNIQQQKEWCWDSKRVIKSSKK